MRALLAAICALFLMGQADPILVPDVSQHEVRVRQGFTGTELLLFGAILDPQGQRAGREYDIIVVLKGPSQPIRLREKEQVAGIPNSGVIQVGDLRIDTNKRQVYRGDERIRLTGMEFSLLELLVSRSGEPFSRGEILKEVWGYTPERHVDTRVVDVHISRLRSKLEDDPANPELILTARGTGYLFQRIVDPVAPEGA